MKDNLKILVLVLCLILTWIFTVPGVQAGQSWFVLSEYSNQMPRQQQATILWEFAQLSLVDGGFEWTVQDRDKLVRCRAELYFTASGALEQADCYREIQGEEISDARLYNINSLALLNQTLIPGDWLNRPLPFTYEAKKCDIVLYEQVGTTRFANYLEVQDRKISREEALGEGMIRKDLQAGLSDKGQLYLVEVRRASDSGNNDLLLQQLWLDGDNLWFYESKAGRRSWRILQK